MEPLTRSPPSLDGDRAGRARRSEWHYWPLYDVRLSWDAFLSAWKSDEVQALLTQDMTEWCAPNAWVPGTPLWTLSRPGYWDTEIARRIQQQPGVRELDRRFFTRLRELHCPAMIQSPLLRQARLKQFPLFHRPEGVAQYDCGPVAAHSHDLSNIASENECVQQYQTYLYDQCKPRVDTFEAYVMIGGHNHLLSAMLRTLQLLLPDDLIVFAQPPDEDLGVRYIIVNVTQCFRFDLEQLYFQSQAE